MKVYLRHLNVVVEKDDVLCIAKDFNHTKVNITFKGNIVVHIPLPDKFDESKMREIHEDLSRGSGTAFV